MTDTEAASHPLRELMRGRAGGRLLDAGTRYGDFIRLLHTAIDGISHTTGIDISVEPLRKARENTSGLYTTYAAASVLALPFDDGTFDTVTMSNALHHLKDAQAGLAEMMRVLRPGGALVIAEYITDDYTDSQGSFIALHDLGGEIARHAGITHNRFYFADEVRGLLAPLGLTDTREDVFVREHVEHDPESILSSVEGFASHLPEITDRKTLDHYRKAISVARLRASRTGIQRPNQLISVGIKSGDV